MKLPKREGAWDFSDEPAEADVDEVLEEEAKDGSPPETSGVEIEGEVDEFGRVVKELEKTARKKPTPKPKKARKKPVPAKDEPELHIDFEDLDIDPPYVEDFKDEFGVYPILSVRKFCKLPMRYNVGGGKKRFRMQSFEVGSELKVSGLEAGKKVDYNILCSHRGDELVLEPNMISKFCKVVNPYHSSFKTKSRETFGETPPAARPKKARKMRDPEAAKKFNKTIEKRKKEAMFSI